MTLPASGAISTAAVRAELGGSGPVTIPSAEVRTLTGVASGPVTLPGNFYGKSGGGSYAATASPSGVSKSGAGAITTPSVTCSVSGGVGPFTYAWAKVSGDDGITINSPTSASTSFSGDPSSGASISATYQCTVTDTGAGNAQVVSNSITATLNDTA